MFTELGSKVTSEHLKKTAFLYIRQSSLRQVVENTESTKRQYALRDRAVALGWKLEQIVVIDTDLGKSGSSIADREGFKKLVSEVGMGNAGIVLGLEVSRLARNCSDWHRLLEICALTKTLILDEDGVYDPGHFNDRLVLGLKGTMSEAELHILNARLQGGRLNKARRGELKVPLPVGLRYDNKNKPVLDPDKQVQESFNLFFDTFKRTQSTRATIRHFLERGLKFPSKVRYGINKGEIVWIDIYHSKALRILHNPKYAGAFCYGRIKTHSLPNGKKKYSKVPAEKCIVLLKNANKGYISWDDYENNLKILHDNSKRYGHGKRNAPAREGPALLQGIVICGICGKRMTVRYHLRHGKLIPDYVCQREGIEYGKSPCQVIHAKVIEAEVSKLVVESVNPLSLEITIGINNELKKRYEQIDKLHQTQVERARYQADLARRRYIQVDPENRLVADSLEAEWNEKLRELNKTQDDYETYRKNNHDVPKAEEIKKIMQLVDNFPAIWNNPKTPDIEKKRIVRLIIEDVTLIKKEQVTMHIRFRGGATRTIITPRPKLMCEVRKTSQEVVEMIDHLLNSHRDTEVAEIMNTMGYKSGTNLKFTKTIILVIRRCYNLKSRKQRLLEQGLITLNEISNITGIAQFKLKMWARNGDLESYIYDERNERLFRKPEKHVIDKIQAAIKNGKKHIIKQIISDQNNGV